MSGLFTAQSGGWFPVEGWPGTDRPPAVNPNNATLMPRSSPSRGPDIGVAATPRRSQMAVREEDYPQEVKRTGRRRMTATPTKEQLEAEQMYRPWRAETEEDEDRRARRIRERGFLSTIEGE